jgi:phosphatidylserine/phosphatidylglycerophosphate/cardiolipin synthase-like enzyme
MAKKSWISEEKYREAVRMARAIEEPLGLTVGRFDPKRMPKLTFNDFQTASATVAVSPDSSFRFLKHFIDQAKSTLILYIYDVSAPYLLDLLAAAKSRGVKIRAMFDANFGGTAELAALKKVAVSVKAAPSKGDRSVFTVCHQKFLVIDGKTVIVESANWARSSVPQITSAGTFKKGNREWFICFENNQIANWFTALFNADFKIPAKLSAAAAAPPAPLALKDVLVAAAVQPPAQLFDFATLKDPSAVVTPIVSPDNYLREVKALLKTAQRSVSLQHQYILAGKGIKDLLEIIAERRAQAPQFRLRIITSAAFPENWEATKKTLDSAGMLGSLRALNTSTFTHCHNKGVIVDEQAVVISSTNWSENSVLRAREAGVLVRSKPIAKFYDDVFELDWKEGIKPADVEASATVIDGADAL